MEGQAYLTTLPGSLEELPAGMRTAVFGEGRAADLSEEIHAIMQAARRTPLRNRNLVLQQAVQGSAGDSQEGAGDIAAKAVAACIQHLRGESGGATGPAQPCLGRSGGGGGGTSIGGARRRCKGGARGAECHRGTVG